MRSSDGQKVQYLQSSLFYSKSLQAFPWPNSIKECKDYQSFFFLSLHIFSLEMEGLSDDAIGDIDEVKLANISLS